MPKNKTEWVLTAEHTEGGVKEIATITSDLSGGQAGLIFTEIVRQMESESIWPEGFDAILTDEKTGYMWVLEGDYHWEPIF